MQSERVLLELNVLLDENMIVNRKDGYSFLQLFIDIAGTFDLLVFLVGIFIGPIIQTNFTLAQIRELYDAKTKDVSLFKNASPDHKTHNIKLNTSSRLFLICHSVFSCSLFTNCLSRSSHRNRRLLRLWLQGKQKLE